MKNQKVISDIIKAKDVSSYHMYEFRESALLSVRSELVLCKIFTQY